MPLRMSQVGRLAGVFTAWMLASMNLPGQFAPVSDLFAFPSGSSITPTQSIATASTAADLATNSPATNSPGDAAGRPQDTPAIPPVPPEVDPALRDSQGAIASTNLVSRQTVDKAAQLHKFQAQLDLARQQHRQRNFDLAEKGLVILLNSPAPPEFHRSALLELALIAQDTKRLTRAQQIYSQFVQKFQEDPGVPEVLLRQGLLYREMGAPVMALSKFYAVMSSALTLKLDRLAYYQRLVLQAQTEIADTYYLDGKFTEAADFFSRLLKLDNPQLNAEQVLFKLVRSWSAAGRYPEAEAQARLFVSRHPDSDHLPEVRFLLADALKHLGRKREAIQEVLALMQSQRALAEQDRESWLYWQQRTGNEIANTLYQEGDYINALEIYLRLANLNATPSWCLPARYQAALVLERLKQPQRAADLYARILEDAKGLGGEPSSVTLKTVLEMAAFRKERLGWQTQADTVNQQFSHPAPATTNSVTP